MGCIVSKIHKEEAVRRCKERKKLMKQLVSFRREFAAAQIAYLRALRNTGITLRQFTEVDSLELEIAPLGLALPPSPPPPLPPSPPPPPPFSPDVRRISNAQKGEPNQEECDDDSSCGTPPPPPSVQSSAWEFWDPFAGPSSSPSTKKKNMEDGQQAEDEEEDEDWAETNTEFEEEKEGGAEVGAALAILPEKSPVRELTDDGSSMVSWNTKDTADVAMVVWKSKKTLAGIVKELDEYFLKASAGVKEIGVIFEANCAVHLPRHFRETKKNSCKSAKVFSALSWSWSSKSLQSSREAPAFHGNGDASKPGGLCATLDKLYAEEQRLYAEVKEEEITKCRLERKTILLQKQEARDQEWMKVERTRSCVENLQTEIMSLQESIDRTRSSILKLRDEELQPQLVELSFGLMQMWQTMFECHQVQNHIALQLNHLNNHLSTDPTSDYHRQATAQLEAEVNAWYNALCSLLKSQREFVRSLNQWVALTDCLSDNQPIDPSSGGHAFCEEWHLSLERLPDKVASEAIKSFASVIHSIILQHAEERKLQKKYNHLEKRLEKELKLLSKKEKDFNESSIINASSLSMNHPLVIKRAKTDAFKKRVEEEKSKYTNSVQVSRAMMLNNLQTGLPNIFRAMTGFASACAQSFEAVHGHAKAMNHHDDSAPF
ncbi:protein ALTERED PHOSPHATE STARVATION RESPONSE 1 [Magnolia sinica]|uniref:protein ALTERED PHOSPHATE STARVATION RESPONSE 1 n=1 Tax=Magnolia sinica TaxID=86752 RepID=UPI00265A2B10|nr:protein ALTERED PHOSPHATE STARVATION RESPONSE 1 [Magnolia sinica]